MKYGKLDLNELKKYFIPVLKLQERTNGISKYYVNQFKYCNEADFKALSNNFTTETIN